MSAWIDALREHPDAVLWLDGPARARAAQPARGRRACGSRPPTASCSRRSCRRPSTSRGSRCADLALDVLPYGSHTTGSDALWAGVPLLTCRGRTFAGRVGASLCHAVQLPELVTESLPDYARASARAVRRPGAARALPRSTWKRGAGRCRSSTPRRSRRVRTDAGERRERRTGARQRAVARRTNGVPARSAVPEERRRRTRPSAQRGRAPLRALRRYARRSISSML